MTFKLPELPYAKDQLEPHISAETLDYHHGKHHQAYVNNLNKMIEGTEFSDLDLEDIIKKSDGGIFNNAAQIWNHTFYWNSLSPNGGGEPSAELAEAINQSFGSFDEFKQQFSKAAMGRFGSGWAWLIKDGDKLSIESTANADTPIKDNKQPLLTCDVWEHAYYIDTRNDRAKYVENFWNLVNWDFAAENFKK